MWRTTITDDLLLAGPMASDLSGATYFIHDGYLSGTFVPSGSEIISLDACGRERWRSPWRSNTNNILHALLMVSGSQLIAQHGDIQAFDLATGRHRWTVDMFAFGRSAGIGDLSRTNSLMAAAVAADGTVFVPTNAGRGNVTIVAITPNGVPSVLARVPNVAPQGLVTDLIIDSAGNIDVSITTANVSPSPGTIDSFARDGAPRFSTRFAEIGFQDRLMSGGGLILLEDESTLMDLRGGSVRRLANTLPASRCKPAVMDAAGNFFCIASELNAAAVHVARFAQDGAMRWSSTVRGDLSWHRYGGPLLGQQRLYLYTAPFTTSTEGIVQSGALVTSFDLATGASQSWSFAPRSGDHVSERALLTAASQLVFAHGNEAVGLSSGGDTPPPDSPWPTPRGGTDQRGATLGR